MHWFVLPAIEARGEKGRSAHIHRESLVHISHAFNLVLVVLGLHGVLLARQNSDSRSPKEDCEHVLTALPAIVLLLIENLPLGRSWHKMFRAQDAIDDESLGEEATLHVDFTHVSTDIVHALVSIDAAQL